MYRSFPLTMVVSYASTGRTDLGGTKGPFEARLGRNLSRALPLHPFHAGCYMGTFFNWRPTDQANDEDVLARSMGAYSRPVGAEVITATYRREAYTRRGYRLLGILC